MPRFAVPFSTRTMYGTVTPSVVVVVAISAASGGFVGSYAVNCPVTPFLYENVYCVGALHAASSGVPRPASTVEQIHGCTCSPENTGPPIA